MKKSLRVLGIVISLLLTLFFSEVCLANEANKTYEINLEKWKIDGDPTNNAVGITNALNWAAEEGYSTIKFPTKEYLIDENSCVEIKDMSNVTIDLNGATLKLNPNALLKSKIIHMQRCVNVNLINGTIAGDINEHDYSNPTTTEGNIGLLIDEGVLNCNFQGLTIRDSTGWGVTTGKGKEFHQSRSGTEISKNNLESGSYDAATGDKVVDDKKIRTIQPLNVQDFKNVFDGDYFIFAYDFGYMNNPHLSTREFTALFYDENGKFMEATKDQLMYKKTAIPAGAAKAHFVIHQPNLPTSGDGDFNGAVAFLTYYEQPTGVVFEDCTFDNNKSLGMAICGGESFKIRNNTFTNTGTLSPAHAIDIEDGWEFTNDIEISDNVFNNNIGDLVVCAGDNIVVKNNEFAGNVNFNGRATRYKIENNTFRPNSRPGVLGLSFEYRTDTSIQGNTYYNRNVSVKNLGGKSVIPIMGTELTWKNETFINSSILSMSNVVELRESEFKIEDGFTGSVWLAGRIRESNFNIGPSVLRGAQIYDSTMTLSGNANCQEHINPSDNIEDRNVGFYGTTIKNGGIATINNESLTIKDCILQDTAVITATWGGKVDVLLEDNQFEQSQATDKAPIQLSAG